MSPPSATADIPSQVDRRIWRACAGASVQIPSLYSRVYYFPQGHFEHCCDSSVFSTLPSATSPVLCLVSSIELLADPITDEVFAHLALQPLPQNHQFDLSNVSRFGRYETDEEENKVVTFAKILTPSDANNGGGFSVPRYCADSVFPPLDFHADPPVQQLKITDIHGADFEFRHIYRGTPRRHLLTTGWSKFVNSKKLIAGDSVVFMRNSAQKMFVGVRRAPIPSSCGTSSFYGEDELSGYHMTNGGTAKEDDVIVKKGFRRTGNGKLTYKAVSDAMNKAANGHPFEVVYYPTAGWSDFVVKAEDVEASVRLVWPPGTRVKMAMETEDSSRISWFQGTVSSRIQESGPWRGSLWKQLQITWDEPEVLQDVKRVNPWQVELIANPSQFAATFPPTKRSKYPNSAGLLSGEDAEILYTGRGLTHAAPAEDPSPFMFSYTTTFPAGMQGARHYYETGFYNPTGYMGENPPQIGNGNFFSPLPGLGKVGSPPPSTSNSTNQSSGNEPVGNRGTNSGKANSFQLFGKMINVEERCESSKECGESGLDEVDGSKESSENETQLSLMHGHDNEAPKETILSLMPQHGSSAPVKSLKIPTATAGIAPLPRWLGE